MTITVNGQDTDVARGITVAALLQQLDVPRAARGVAVAVDTEVVPRAEWATFAVSEGARVEVLTAVQGG